ncbi:MAG: YkgJ family cysteine cluster protein [Polyangiaceae bacterium]|nr:YkgJ family cysteine cluster protein [Polyangiaceae bacterium]
MLARRHRQDGARVVVLHDVKTDATIRVEERAWIVINGMDGTRDVAGLAAYATAKGAPTKEDEVQTFVADLAAAGLVEDGVASETPSSRSNSSSAGDRVIEHLPAFSLACDGRGTCCRFYPSVVFSPLEAARARARLPMVERAGLEERQAFTPLAGTDDRMLAVALVDGRCAYLEEDGRCGIHRAGSAEEKPLGCRVYPARFVDDGTAIRATPWLECTCVLRSGAEPPAGGDPLTSASHGRDLDPAIFIETLPAMVRIGDDTEDDAARVAAISRRLAEIPITDGVAALYSLGKALDEVGLDGAEAALISPVLPGATWIRPRLDILAPRIDRFSAETWRSLKDLPRQLAGALETACDLVRDLPDELLQGPGTYRNAEAFYVRALLFGHQLVHPKGRLSMASMAYDRAFRVILARALGVVATLAEMQDPAFSQPLALVEAAMRAYGLGGYARDLDPKR